MKSSKLCQRSWIYSFIIIALVAGLSIFNFVHVTQAASLVANGSFEDGLNGWETNGSDAISIYEDPGWPAPEGGEHRLDYNFYGSTSLQADTFQEIENIENGSYILSAYVANSDMFQENYMYALSGGQEYKVEIPNAPNWTLVELPIEIKDGEVTVGFYTEVEKEAWQGIDVVELKLADQSPLEPTPEPDGFIKGVDISSLTKVEDNGGKFYDNGIEKDAIEIFTDYGANYGRLVIWKDPYQSDGYNDLTDTVTKAKRIKEAGMKLLLNFHYSDTWADPGNQDIPQAWQDYSFEELVDAVYDHTEETLAALANEGIIPDMVQIGNEIRPGMLFPHGRIVDNDFSNLATLLNAGIQAVRDAEGGDNIDIMLHLDQGGDNGAFRWWFDGVIAAGVTDFQVIGASYYPYWHGSLDDLAYNLNDISARYDKDVVVVETAYGFTLDDADGHPNIFNEYLEEVGGYPATEAGQAKFLYDLLEVIKNVPNNRGKGFFYWEPAWLGVEGAGWISGEGNAWENQAMFDFDGHALESLNIFREGYVAPEPEPRPKDPEPDEDPTLQELTLHSLQKPTRASSSAGDGGGKRNAPENAVDGDEYTSWGTDEGVGAWWEVDLEELSSIKRILFHFWDGVQEVEIEISDDGDEYTSLGTFAVTTNKMDYQLPDYTNARYIKVIITEATSNWVGFMEFKAYGDETVTLPDLIAPVSEAVIDGELDNGSFIDLVNITITATDEGTGIDRIEYSLDQGETWHIYDDVLTIQEVGEYQLLYRAIDLAGNIEDPNELTFTIIAKTPEERVEDKEDPDPTIEDENDDEGEGETVVQPDEEKEEKLDGSPLPRTATSNGNYLLIGAMLILVGSIAFYMNYRKRKSIEG